MQDDWMERMMPLLALGSTENHFSNSSSFHHQLMAMDGLPVEGHGTDSLTKQVSASRFVANEHDVFPGKEVDADTFHFSEPPPPYHLAISSHDADSKSTNSPVQMGLSVICPGDAGLLEEAPAALCFPPTFPPDTMEVVTSPSTGEAEYQPQYSPALASPSPIGSPQEMIGTPFPSRPQSCSGEVPTFLKPDSPRGECSLYNMDCTQVASGYQGTRHVPQMSPAPQFGVSHFITDDTFEEEQLQCNQDDSLARPDLDGQSCEMPCCLGFVAGGLESVDEGCSKWPGPTGTGNVVPPALDDKEKLIQDVVGTTTDEELVECTRRAVETNDHSVLTKVVLKRKLELDYMNKGQNVPDVSNFPRQQEKPELRPDEKEKEIKRKKAGRISAKKYRDNVKLKKEEQHQILEQELVRNKELTEKMTSMQRLKERSVRHLQLVLPLEHIMGALRTVTETAGQEKAVDVH